MGHMARSHVRNLKQRVTLMADTRMYIDEQAACDAKTCMTEEGGGTWATDTICTLEQP